MTDHQPEAPAPAIAERAVDAALAADSEWMHKARQVVFVSPSRDQVRAMLEAAAPLIAAAERGRIALLDAAEDAADPETPLSDAQHAIGNAIRWVESQAMTGKLLDPAEVQRVLVGIIFRQWTGGLRVGGVAVQPPAELEAIGTGPLLDPDCRAGKCSSCVGAPCEHECHKDASHG